MGPPLIGVQILEGDLQGMEGFVARRITRSRRGNICIDDSTWGPEADSIESGYRVQIGSIHIFIGLTDRAEPEPDPEAFTEGLSRLPAMPYGLKNAAVTYQQISDSQGMGQPSTAPHHAFVGFIGGSPEPEHAIEIPTHGDIENLSDDDS